MYRIYWNLHRGCWSIQTRIHGKGWRVTDYAETLSAYNVTFSVSEAGRQRVIAEGRKNVHAYAIARRCTPNRWQRVPYTWDPMKISYHPYEAGHFATPSGTAVHGLNVAYFNDQGEIITDPKAVLYG